MLANPTWKNLDDCTLLEYVSTEGNATCDKPKEAKRRAFEELVARYLEPLLRVATGELRNQQGNKLEALDVVQEVFARLLEPRILRQYDRRFPLAPWLKRSVRNRARDLLRREQRYCSAGDRDGTQPSARQSVTPLNELITREDLKRAMDALSVREQWLVRLFYLADFSGKDIAKRLGVSTTRVYNELHRIRTILRRTMDYDECKKEPARQFRVV